MAIVLTCIFNFFDSENFVTLIILIHNTIERFNLENCYMQKAICLFIRVVYSIIFTEVNLLWALQICVTNLPSLWNTLVFQMLFYWLSHSDIHQALWHGLNRYDEPPILMINLLSRFLNDLQLYNQLIASEDHIISCLPKIEIVQKTLNHKSE